MLEEWAFETESATVTKTNLLSQVIKILSFKWVLSGSN